MDSILNTIKKLLGVDMDDDSFDADIIVNINSAIFSLSQIGIIPNSSFIVTSASQNWSDYISDNSVNLECIKTYIYLKTKMIFDPPTNSTTTESFNNSIKELEWRIRLATES